MYFDDEGERFLNPELFHLVRHAISSNLGVTPYGLRSFPTHTEDGIPIRKLYVSNLPPKTTRTELFGVFAQYGFIKSCWLRMGDKGPNKTPTPTYAFVTYSNPADAHKALQAPIHEKMLRGRNLRISPADSWHQPAEDADGRVRWKPRGQRRDDESPTQDPIPETTPENAESGIDINEQPSTSQEQTDDSEECYNMFDILNQDCLNHVLTYVPIRDLIRSERVSKGWQNMVQEYLQGIRMFKTSWWQHTGVTLTTAVLRRVLQRLGACLLRLHIDHHWSALNDRTAHSVGKFCPNLEELKVVGMHTKNWNPLIYGCKQLKSLTFVSCSKLTDTSLVHLVKNDSCIESLTIANNTHVTGLFLTGSSPPALTELAFYNCYSLQGTVLTAALENLPNITTLKLDVCPITMWKIIPTILTKLPKLEELSLSEYMSVELCMVPEGNEAFCEAIATLTELKTLNLSRNIYITNAVLKQVAQSCPKLQSLNISCCNSRKAFPFPGVGDEGLLAVCRGCTELQSVDISYLAALSDAGVAGLARCWRLRSLIARGNSTITAAPFAALLAACHDLQELDLCGCDNVSEEVVSGAVSALCARPRPLAPPAPLAPLALRLAGTVAALQESEFPTHKQLVVDATVDRSNPHLRPDFVDRVIDDSSDESLQDLYDYDHDHDDFDDDIFAPDSDDELFLEDELMDFDGLYAYGAGHDIILL